MINFKLKLNFKFLICILIIAATVTLFIFLKSFFYGFVGMYFDNSIRVQTGHIRIVQKGYMDKEFLHPLTLAIDNYEAVISRFRNIPEIEEVVPRLKFSVLLNFKGKNKAASGIGVHPWIANRIIDLENRLVSGRYFTLGRDEILIGNKMAQEMDLKVGDIITLVVQTAYGSVGAMNFKVVGIFDTGFEYINESTFYIPLDKAQNLLDLNNKVTEVLVFTTDYQKVPLIAKNIEKHIADISISAIPWSEQGMVSTYMKLINRFCIFFCLILALLAGFIIMDIMLILLFWKRREMLSVLYEGLIIGVVGGLIGLVVGIILTLYVAKIGIDISALQCISLPFSSHIYPILKFSALVFAFISGLITALLAALLSAFFEKRITL